MSEDDLIIGFGIENADLYCFITEKHNEKIATVEIKVLTKKNGEKYGVEYFKMSQNNAIA